MSASPKSTAARAAYEQALRERYGDLSELAAEVQRPEVPPPPTLVVGTRRSPYSPPPRHRAPVTAGAYADEHERLQRWIKRSHPDWHPQLCLVGGGGVAHVITRHSDRRGYSLCGKAGPTTAADDTIPLCRVCTA